MGQPARNGARSCYCRPNSNLFTDVLQVGRAGNDLARIARDRAQVLVDSPQVAVGHIPEKRPSHDLPLKGGSKQFAGTPGAVQLGCT
jgi:hypothetical protein